jgi:hypothetical protein
VVNAEYHSPGDTYPDADTNKFIQDNFPDKELIIHPKEAIFEAGTYGPGDAGHVPTRVAIWDSYKNVWVLD